MSHLYKYLFLTILFLGLFCAANAQDQATHKLYLKDGRIVEGVILEQKIGETITMKLEDGESVTFAESEVELLVRTQASNTPLSYHASPTVLPSRRAYRKARPINYRKDRSIYQNVSFALGFGQSNWGGVAVTPTIPGYTIGYRHNQYINVGIGAALEPYDGGVGIAPIFAELRGDIGKQKKTMPHYFGQLGYGAPLSTGWEVTELKGGVYSHIGVGYKFNTRGRLDWTLSVGMKSQKTWQRRQDWRLQGDIVGYRTYRRLVFQIAMGF